MVIDICSVTPLNIIQVGMSPVTIFFKKETRQHRITERKWKLGCYYIWAVWAKGLQGHQAKIVIMLHQEAHLGPYCTPCMGSTRRRAEVGQFDDG